MVESKRNPPAMTVGAISNLMASKVSALYARHFHGKWTGVHRLGDAQAIPVANYVDIMCIYQVISKA